MSDQRYIVYDSRAEYDEDEASVYCSAMTLEEAKRDAKEWPDSVIFEYDLVNGEAIRGRRVR